MDNEILTELSKVTSVQRSTDETQQQVEEVYRNKINYLKNSELKFVAANTRKKARLEKINRMIDSYSVHVKHMGALNKHKMKLVDILKCLRKGVDIQQKMVSEYRVLEDKIIESNIDLMELERALSREFQRLTTLHDLVSGDSDLPSREEIARPIYNYDMEQHPRDVTERAEPDLSVTQEEFQDWRKDMTQYDVLCDRYPQFVREDLFRKRLDEEEEKFWDDLQSSESGTSQEAATGAELAQSSDVARGTEESGTRQEATTVNGAESGQNEAPSEGRSNDPVPPGTSRIFGPSGSASVSSASEGQSGNARAESEPGPFDLLFGRNSSSDQSTSGNEGTGSSQERTRREVTISREDADRYRTRSGRIYSSFRCLEDEWMYLPPPSSSTTSVLSVSGGSMAGLPPSPRSSAQPGSSGQPGSRSFGQTGSRSQRPAAMRRTGTSGSGASLTPVESPDVASDVTEQQEASSRASEEPTGSGETDETG